MKHLLFAGPANVGKTTIIGRLAKNLVLQGYKVVPEGITEMPDKTGYGIPKKIHDDFYVLLEKDGIYILLYTWGDNEKLLEWLKKYKKELLNRGFKISLIIMATRDGSEGLYRFTYKEFGLNETDTIEVPMGRMVRGDRRDAGLDWYINSLSNFLENQVMPKLLNELR
jgi:GTPase SAR1 family protein